MSTLTEYLETKPAPRGEIPLSEHELQHALSELAEHRFRPAVTGAPIEQELAQELRLRRLEDAFVQRERQAVAAQAEQAPTDADAFVAWYEQLRETGPGQGDPLFPWLGTQATRDQLCWFLTQEVAGEAGFEDLVAMTQIKMPVRAKLELARNYWDEMGRGAEPGMHGPMLARLAATLGLCSTKTPILPEPLALANLLVALAANRRYAYHSIGALGVIELTAPTRASYVNDAMRRLQIAAHTRQYFALHATLDVQHSAAWNREVLHPLVAENPDVARPIAEGALMRLLAGQRCFDRYRRELGVPV